MSIGKDSITKRVAKVDTSAQNTDVSSQSEQVETIVPAKKTTPKKSPSTSSKSTSKTVITNIAKETVESVIGHKEDSDFKKVEIGCELPYYLL